MRMHHLHKVQIVLSMSSTQIEEEVEDVVQAKVEVVTVAIKAKVNSNNNKMIHKDQTHVEEDNIEARGVKEVTKVFQEFMQEVTTQNVQIMEEQVILNLVVHKNVEVIKGNKIIMYLRAKIPMNQKDCLLCNI